jgi:hypothetical protein
MKNSDLCGAGACVDALVENNVKPNVMTYNTLLAKSETFEQGRQVLSEMRAAGIEGDRVTDHEYRKLLGQGGLRAVTTDDAAPIHDVTAKPALPPRPQSSLS